MDEPSGPPEPEVAKPKPHERVQKLRLGVRVVWWSAMVLAVPVAGAAKMFWAEGPPCTTPFVEFGTGVSKTAKTG